MPFTFNMPKLSPTMESGTIAKWHKAEGDFVEVGDLLLEVSTDKATVEHEAIDPGFLRRHLCKEGDEAAVNEPIAIFSETTDESIDAIVKEVEAAKQQASKKSEESKGAEKGEPERAAPASKPRAAPVAPPPPPPPSATKVLRAESRGANDRILASPLARRLARERGLDLTTVQGTGPAGRVMSRDLERASPLTEFGFDRREAPQTTAGTYSEEGLTPIRRAIARRLLASKQEIPHFYLTIECDAEPMVALREQLGIGGLTPSYNDILTRAVALALRKHPDVNSGFHPANESVIRYQTIDISIAVSLPSGLITPIVRQADYKSIGELSQEIKALAKRAKEGKLKPEEYEGGSFTISNLGMFQIKEFVAIINPPQAAILAVGGIRDLPVVRGGDVVPGKAIGLTLSVDHRVIDGVAGAQFLQTLKRYLENPALLLL